ncbi:glycosyltransferase [Labilibacter sediminis]|nr:glycosyltransferase [Labilibacter sediminis]
MVEVLNFIPASGIWLYLGFILIGTFTIQVFYYLYFFNRLGNKKNFQKPDDNFKYPPVSVIICAKNESKNLEQHLPYILNQKYPGTFEVIVVNDASEDDSELVLAKLKEKNAHLYYTTIPYDKKFQHGKKLALTIGIKAAKYDHFLFTDADCMPASETWIQHMAYGFNHNKEIVLGYGAYKKQSGWANRWQRYDTFQIAIQYLSFALRGVPYMGVGRNMAYTRSLFEANNGFINHHHILSGDDDLFIRDAASRNNTAIIAHSEAHTLSESVQSFKEWKRQKSRHLTTAPLYKTSTKLRLGIEAFSRQLFWTISLLYIFFSTFAPTVFLLVFIKLALQLSVQNRIAKYFKHKNIIWIGILFDYILPITIGLLLLGGKRKAKKNKWT